MSRNNKVRTLARHLCPDKAIAIMSNLLLLLHIGMYTADRIWHGHIDETIGYFGKVKNGIGTCSFNIREYSCPINLVVYLGWYWWVCDFFLLFCGVLCRDKTANPWWNCWLFFHNFEIGLKYSISSCYLELPNHFYWMYLVFHGSSFGIVYIFSRILLIFFIANTIANVANNDNITDNNINNNNDIPNYDNI